MEIIVIAGIVAVVIGIALYYKKTIKNKIQGNKPTNPNTRPK